jgi:hypothetical protein
LHGCVGMCKHLATYDNCDLDLADLMHANVWSEDQFLVDVRMRSARARRQINRIEDAVDALEVTGRARGGHLRPGCSGSRRLQLERD